MKNSHITFVIRDLHAFMAVAGIVLIIFSTTSCGVYTLSGGTTGTAKTVSVTYFTNQAPNQNPTLAQTLTDKLKDKLLRETRLRLVDDTADMQFSGTITSYIVAPAAVVSGDQAAKNRLTIVVNMKFTNRTDKTKNYNTTVSSFSDFDANKNLSDVEVAVVDDATTKVVQEIYNKALNNW